MSDPKPHPDSIDWNSAIAEMRSEKMTDDEIHQEIARDFGSTIADQQLKRGVFAPKEVSTIWPKGWEKLTDEIPWEGPAAVAATGATLWGAKQAINSETGQKVLRSIKDRLFSPSTPELDPFAGPVEKPGTALNAPAVAQGAPTPVTAQEGPSAEQIRIVKQRAAQASLDGRPVVSGVGPVTQSVVENTIAPQPIQTAEQLTATAKPKIPAGTTAETELGKTPKDMGLVERSSYNTVMNEASAAEKAAAPKGSAPAPVSTAPVVPKLTKEQQGMKNHMIALYGGGAEGEKAYAKAIEILGHTPEFPKGQGGGLSAEDTNTIKSWRKTEIAGPKVNLTHDMKKVMKGGGGIALLAAIPGFADAAQRKDYGAMSDIATDFAVLPFAQSRETSAGTLNTPEARELFARSQAKTVGGGRGIAPPSAYMR